MAQAGYTPISLYYSTTASVVPIAANLVPGELAINIADGKLYFENSSGVVTLLASSAGAGGTFTAPVVIEGTTTDAALRITQLGTGNALLVEDSTNPDSTPFVIDQFGAVVVGGTSSSSATISGSNQFAMVGTTTAGAKQGLSRWDNSTGPFSVQFAKSRSGTIGTQTVVSSGDSIAQLEFFGSDGTAFIEAARITAAVDGTPGTNDMPGRLVFSTTADGAATPTERMRIDSVGNIGIGTSSPSAQLTIAGSSSVSALKLPNIEEVATVSATAATGTINYDITTQSVLYYTSNASANWTVNFRGSSGTSLNTLMATGESISVTFLVTQGTTAYYNSAVQVDGSSVTPKWQGGSAPTSGNTSSIDSYTYVIIKTGSAAFTVLASQTKFA